MNEMNIGISPRRGRRLFISVCILTAMLLSTVAACFAASAANADGGGGWPQFQRDEVRSGATEEAAPAAAPVLSWSRYTWNSGSTGIETPAILANGMAYVHAGNGLWAFNAVTGETVWHQEIPGSAVLQTSAPAYGGGKLFIATFDGYVRAYNASDGTSLWNNKLSDVILQCPITYYDGHIYIGQGGSGGDFNSYFCLDDGNGSVVWEYSSQTVGYLWSGASIAGGFIVFANYDAVLTSLNFSTGQLIDSLDLYGLEPDAGKARASVTYHDGFVYTTSESGLNSGYIWKIGYNPATGLFDPGLGWHNPIGFSTSTPMIHEGRVYVGEGEHGEDGSLICLNDADGSIIWSYAVPGGVKSSPALSIQDEELFIYFHTSMDDGHIYCLNGSGSLLWQWDPPDDTAYILQGVSLANGRVYLGTCSGRLYCLADDEGWLQFQRDAVNSGVTSSPAPTGAPYEAWSAFTHHRATHGIDVTPIAANGKVFVIDVNGYAWAFDSDDGGVIWSTELEDDTRFKLAIPACGDGKVFFATDLGYIYALNDSDGLIIWGGKLTEGTGQNAELNTQITYKDGKLYVGSWEGKYYCLDAAGDGSSPHVDWVYHAEGTRYDWYSGTAVIGGYVLFGNTDGLLTCLEKDTGTPVDYCNLSAEFGVTAGSIRSAVGANDAEDRIYLTSKNGYIYAIGFDASLGRFDASSGWCADIDNYSTSTPVFYNGSVYVCSGGSFYNQEGGVYRFDDSSGARTWFNDLGVTYGSQASPALSIQDGEPYIYISTGEPESAVMCIDADGETLWKHVPSQTEYSLQGVSIYDGKVFFGNDAGYLFALAASPEWDVNGDGSINVLDLSLVGDLFGEAGDPGWIPEDVDSNGVINVLDMSLVGDHFGE